MATTNGTSPRGAYFARRLKSYSPPERDALAVLGLCLHRAISSGSLVVSRSQGPDTARDVATMLLRADLLDNELRSSLDSPLLAQRVEDLIAEAAKIQGGWE